MTTLPHFWSDTPKTIQEKQLTSLCLMNYRVWFRLSNKKIHVCNTDGCDGVTYKNVAEAIKEEKADYGIQ